MPTSPRIRRLAVVLLAGAIALGGVVPSPASAVTIEVQRLAGADRYSTAAAVSAAYFGPGLPVAYVATGTNYPDALAAGPVAALQGAPILLVAPNQLPAATAGELGRLRPGRIVVLGGPGAISDAVVSALGAYHAGGGVARLAGGDRFATAAAVSASHFAPGVPAVFVATGRNYPDALSGGVAAARANGPLLLVEPNGVPAATAAELARLQPNRIVVLGGSGAVADAVLAALAGYHTGGGVTRLAGADRYETAVAVSRSSFAAGTPSAFLATGADFPDALAAVPAAYRAGAPLLLVRPNPVPVSVTDEVKRLNPSRLVPVGGTAVVSDGIVSVLRTALGEIPPLPACTYTDILTPHHAYEEWHRSLLDTAYMLPSTYYPGDLVDSSAAGLNGGYPIRAFVAPDLAAMAHDARAAGVPIEVVSAFRSYETQEATFNYWVSVGGWEQALRTSARAGHSEHQLGTTVDLKSAGGPLPWEVGDWAATPAGAWVAANAWRYGFIMSYPAGSFGLTCYDYEPWHYRYVGRAMAAEVVQSGLTLREWLWWTGSGI